VKKLDIATVEAAQYEWPQKSLQGGRANKRRRS